MPLHYNYYVKHNYEVNMSEILSVEKLLGMPLYIPDYQRPYKWTRKNVADLFGDIDKAIEDSRRADHADFRYRVGSVILHREHTVEGDRYNIVDGQQRLITLSLIRRALDPGYSNALLSYSVHDGISRANIFDNNLFIREWLSMRRGSADEYRSAFSDILEAVMLTVDEVSEAFQLFDSQNTRGKELDPHDLLKAYHLREMDDYPFEKLSLIRQWEDIPPRLIRELFSLYLFPILMWSRREKSRPFVAQDIDAYKGVTARDNYTYAQRARKAMPCFQIAEPFCAGSDFFKMVEHYIALIADLKNEIMTDGKFAPIKDIIYADGKDTPRFASAGFRYAVNLFHCALLFYYDRFHCLDEMAVKKIFVWAMMIRVDMENLGMDTINNYAVGARDRAYTNRIPMFFDIAVARNHREIANMKILVTRDPDKATADAWNGLYARLKTLMGENNGK